MKSMLQNLNQLFSQALNAVVESPDLTSPCISRAKNPKFGDYQANFAMSLAKKLGKNPRDIADQVVAAMPENNIIQSMEVAGPGFVNITLANAAIVDYLVNSHQLPCFGVSLHLEETVVVDYGGANVAKEMHVGHLRSANIGDAIVRLLTFLGYKVIRQNHLGDWGTQFGMLIELVLEDGLTIDDQTPIGTLNKWYQQAKKRFDERNDFAQRAKARVVKLQQGDEKTRELWRQLVRQSALSFNGVYRRLNVLLEQSDNCGESFYNDKLSGLVQELKDKRLAVISDGAAVVFLPGFVDRDKNPLPMIIQKTDGGYLYATTDLAAVHYRLTQLHASRLIYVTDARQKQHFSMIFAATKAAGWADDSVQLEHVAFGSVLGEDKKPFKTRSGESVRLAALLDEAEARVMKVLESRSHDHDVDLVQVAKSIGVGAIKYADLASDKQRDYVFNWDTMLAFTGNTGPYLQNALVRIYAIFRKAGLSVDSKLSSNLELTHEKERLLAMQLSGFVDLLEEIGQDLAMHRLCHYLFDLAAAFHQFYEHCPVLSAESESSKQSRLLLCQLAAHTLKQGLELLGLDALQKM